MDNKYILFCEEHYNPLGIIRTLGENGIFPYIIVLKSDYHFLEKSKYARKKQIFYVDSVEEGYEVLLKRFGNEDNKPFIFTSDDTITAFLDEHYEEVIKKFYFFNAGKTGRIKYYQDKKNILDAAERNGLKVLPTVLVENGELNHGIDYPIITKAENSLLFNWKSDVYICESEEELKEAYKSIRSQKVIIQKFINKKNEYCLDGFSYNKGNCVVNTIESKYKYNVKGSYSSYMSVDNFYNPEIEMGLQKMFKEIGFEGIFSVEFLIDENDNYYFLEINFRNSTWSYASTCAGMPLPILWSKAMIGKLPKNYIKKIPDNFSAMVEIDDFRHRVRGKRTKLSEWIKDYKKCNCKYYVGKKDIIPFLYTILYRVKKYLNKKIRRDR